jgi:hypothetical protein
MENVFKYYEFTDFFKDESGVFSGNQICFTALNDTHFLIFEKMSMAIIFLFLNFPQNQK